MVKDTLPAVVPNWIGGWREPGTEALDVYYNLKDVYTNIDPGSL
jgi:hypothetical protein